MDDELLKLSDHNLIKHERVRNACDDLDVDVGDYGNVSVADVAFAMRDACVNGNLRITWFKKLESLMGTNLPREAFACEMDKHSMICAAVLAWEESQKCDGEE